jgi:hypothetical protein
VVSHHYFSSYFQLIGGEGSLSNIWGSPQPSWGIRNNTCTHTITPKNRIITDEEHHSPLYYTLKLYLIPLLLSFLLIRRKFSNSIKGLFQTFKQDMQRGREMEFLILFILYIPKCFPTQWEIRKTNTLTKALAEISSS